MKITMKKIYNIESLIIENGFLIINVDRQELRIKLSDVSTKLSNANVEAQNNFKISPSGYGIHWPMIDEDISVSGLLKMGKS